MPLKAYIVLCSICVWAKGLQALCSLGHELGPSEVQVQLLEHASLFLLSLGNSLLMVYVSPLLVHSCLAFSVLSAQLPGSAP